MLRTACEQNKVWQELGYPPVFVGVNLSAREFRQNAIGQLVSRVLAETGLDARWLELEITETDVMLDTASSMETLRALAAKGVRVSLDDFAASSLFSGRFFTIARAIIAMSHRFEVAEGVETREQLEFLRKCDWIQGF